MADIRGIEIFDIGTHNGDKYTEADIDDIIAAHKELDFQPCVKIGHTKDEPGAPAFGWITNLKKSGTKLLGDFESMHDSVIEAIRRKQYNAVSSEIYFNLKRGGKTFRRALKAVALLGAEVPAVAGLKPLHKMQFAIAPSMFERSTVCSHALNVPAKSAGEEVDRRAFSMLRAGTARSYSEALTLVLQQDRDLARRYEDRCESRNYSQDGFGSDPGGVAFDRRIKEIMRDRGIHSYSAALDIVLVEEPTIARTYATSSMPGPNNGAVVVQRGEVSKEVHRRCEAKRRDHPSADYQTLLALVLREDPDLKEQYSTVWHD